MNLDQRFKDLAQKENKKATPAFSRRIDDTLASLPRKPRQHRPIWQKLRRCGSSATGHCHFAAQS